MKQQLIVRKSIGSNTKKVEKINSIEGHKDMQKLNTLMYEQEAIKQQPVMSSSTDEGMESYIADKTMIRNLVLSSVGVYGAQGQMEIAGQEWWLVDILKIIIFTVSWILILFYAFASIFRTI